MHNLKAMREGIISSIQAAKNLSRSQHRQAVTRWILRRRGFLTQGFRRRQAKIIDVARRFRRPLAESVWAGRWPVVFSLFLVGPLSSLYAQDKMWQGPPGTSSWFVAENWESISLPTNEENAIINNGTTAQVGALNAVANTVTIGSSTPGSTLQMIGGGDLTISGGSSSTPGIVIGPQGTLRLSGTLGGPGSGVGSIHSAALIENNGTLLYDGVLDHFLSTRVIGSGKLVMAGTGTLLVAVSNAYSGATAINGGVLSISQDANIGRLR